MIPGPYQTVILGERLVDTWRMEILCQLGSKMSRVCLLCSPCLSFSTAASHSQGCHVTSFGFNHLTFILSSRSSGRGDGVMQTVSVRSVFGFCDKTSVSFTPVPVLSLCALQGGGIGGEEEGG